jgi:TonB family protein
MLGLATTSAASILANMLRSVTYFLAIALSCGALAQNQASEGTTQLGFRITKLPPPSYPPIALMAHVSGDVDLIIALKGDGSIESAAVLNGPPMLRQAAVDSAKQTHFECKDCDDGTKQFHVIYRFELGPSITCSETIDSSYPRVEQSADKVTISAQPFGTCDPAAKSVRSAKCLLLWKCGWR